MAIIGGYRKRPENEKRVALARWHLALLSTEGWVARGQRASKTRAKAREPKHADPGPLAPD